MIEKEISCTDQIFRRVALAFHPEPCPFRYQNLPTLLRQIIQQISGTIEARPTQRTARPMGK
jgi:hypothetical protein